MPASSAHHSRRLTSCVLRGFNVEKCHGTREVYGFLSPFVILLFDMGHSIQCFLFVILMLLLILLEVLLRSDLLLYPLHSLSCDKTREMHVGNNTADVQDTCVECAHFGLLSECSLSRRS